MLKAIDILLGVVLVPHVLTCSLPSLLSADALLRLLLTDGVGALPTPCSSQGQLAQLQRRDQIAGYKVGGNNHKTAIKTGLCCSR